MPARRSPVLNNTEQSTIPYVLAIPELLGTPVESPTSPKDVSAQATSFPRAAQEVLARCKSEADALLAAASRDADEIRGEALTKSELLFAEARRRGESAGIAQATKTILEATVAERAKAVAAARAEVIASNASYTHQLKALLAQRVAFIESAEAELVTLAIGIAEQVLGEELRLDRSYITRLAARALARLSSADTVRIRCAPSEHAVLAKSLSTLDSHAGRLTFIPDASLERGAIIVDTDDGIQVDASLSSQLANVRSHLLSRFERHEPLKLAS